MIVDQPDRFDLCQRYTFSIEINGMWLKIHIIEIIINCHHQNRHSGPCGHVLRPVQKSG